MGREVLGRLARAFIAAAAFGPMLAACVGERTGSVDRTAAIPAGAPRVAGIERPSSDDDHARLVAAFGGEVAAARAQALLSDVADRLVRGTDRPDERYRVTILDSAAANAFALPTGRLYVTRGLLALANDTSEVAGVLAHEIAHVTLRHAAARTELAARSALVSRVVEDVLGDAEAGSELKSRSRVAFASFSRSQELEADQIGVRTLSRAGYDPYGAVRFLEALNRNATLRAPGQKAAAPDMLATHPGTPERVAQAREAARRAGSPGLGASDRAAYLTAVEGLPYGDNPQDGMVRGRRFLHPRFGVAFEAPEGFVLENTGRAVVGGSADGARRLLFDALETRSGQDLGEALRGSWSDGLASVEATSVNGHPAVVATSSGRDWAFRLAAVRIGEGTFRLVVGARRAGEAEAAFRRTLASLGPLAPEEARALAPLRLATVAAGPGDTVETLAARMAPGDRSAERFRVLNGLDRGERPKAGERYKIVVE